MAKHPIAILGAADTGTPGAETVYERAGLAYLGGVPFTPVEQNAPNSVQFWSVSLGDNAAASVYAVKSLGVKNASVMYFDNSQGKVAGLGIIPPVMKAAGATSVKTVGVPPTTPDPSPDVATAVSARPDAIYVDIPNNCGVVLKDIKALGYSGKLLGIDPCTSPQAIASAAGAAQGMYIATAFDTTGPQFAAVPGGDDQVGGAQHGGRRHRRGRLRDRHQRAQYAGHDQGHADDKSILAAFKAGSNHPNFMSHPYTCNGQAVAKAVSICNDYYLMEQIQGSKPVIADPTDWITSKGYFKGLRRVDRGRGPPGEPGGPAGGARTDLSSCPATSSS